MLGLPEDSLDILEDFQPCNKLTNRAASANGHRYENQQQQQIFQNKKHIGARTACILIFNNRPSSFDVNC
jgi:hypothetical protein